MIANEIVYPSSPEDEEEEEYISSKLSLRLTMDAYQLQNIMSFYPKIGKSIIYHYNLNKHENPFIFDTNLMG